MWMAYRVMCLSWTLGIFGLMKMVGMLDAFAGLF